MKKNIIFLFLFASMLANAQSFTVNGTVYDENKEPLLGASVSAIGSKVGAITNEKGQYELQLSPGEYVIKASFLGYGNEKLGVSVINENITTDFYLYPKSTVLEEVLVSAVRVNTKVPVTFSNLSKKESQNGTSDKTFQFF
jgi:iron complex outermembrane receptor protein